jgi:hypothetical protein
MDLAISDLAGGVALRAAHAFARGQAPAGTGPSSAGAGASGSDSVSLSAEARAVLARDPAGGRRDGDAAKADPGAPRGPDGAPLDADAAREVERLEKRDREVHTHEQAHQTAGGVHAGAPRYSYEKGPDGRSYATSGEVPIDTAPVPDDPAATIAKMEQVKRAALAPAEPSAADRAIAARADQMRQKAERELAEQQAENRQEGGRRTGGTAPRGSLVSLSA